MDIRDEKAVESIIEKALDAYTIELQKIKKPPPWGVMLSIAATLINMAFSWGVIWITVENHTDRIRLLENYTTNTYELLAQIKINTKRLDLVELKTDDASSRLARIEEKINLISVQLNRHMYK